MTPAEMIQNPKNLYANIVWKNGGTSSALFGFTPDGRSGYKFVCSQVLHDTERNANQIKEIRPIKTHNLSDSFAFALSMDDIYYV